MISFEVMRSLSFVVALCLPSLAVCTSPVCDLGIVGAGAGGAYAAWRAASDGRSVCVFERAGRPGGRIHSLRGEGPRKDLVVEAGGYRFAPKPVVQRTGKITWRIDTPLTAAIIKELGLPTAIYNPNASEWDHGMHKIVDKHGQDAGYLTFIERMLELAVAKGAKVRYSTAVVGLGIVAGEGGSNLVAIRLQNGEEVVVKSAVLNLPQRPVIELLRRSNGSVASVLPRPLYDAVSFPIMKFYVHYDDAWWRNDLGLTSGPFYNKEPSSKVPGHVIGVPTEDPAPLQGQYHDGNVRCDLPGGKCRGFLQTYYGADTSQNPGGIDGAIKYYEPFADSISEDAATHIGNVEPHHKLLLDRVHASLVGFHRAALDAANATAKVAAMRPTGAVLSMWTQGVAGIHAGCHVPRRLDRGDPAPPGLLSKAALQPLPGFPIFVANEAFGPMMCFAEGSLAMSEMALKKMNVSVPKAGWLTEELRAKLLDLETSAGRPPTDPFLLRQETSSSDGDGLAEYHV
mmetsp:Transcript_13606/g.38728  ORF Transcript_13606/g.38728 Transcript_13606/m.38728 type:complete len:513 (-) Transcript_13606:252-1790(-)